MSLPACAPQAEEPAEPVAKEGASTEADVVAIQNVMNQWQDALNAEDLDSGIVLFAEDLIWMPPNAPIVVDLDAFRQFGEAQFEQFDANYRFFSDEIVVLGDWAFNRGGYTAKISLQAGGAALEDTGKCIWILKRQSDGSWKFDTVIWNSDNLPPEGSAT
jgi:ketosteroid isomerase-like protein